jgi:hypothetical protein
MAREKGSSDGQGTFAQLYDVHEELSRKNNRPLGRPPKKVRRKPTTIHLTQAESRSLSKMQLQASEYFSVNRSEIVGVAIEVLATILEKNGENLVKKADFADLEGFRQAISGFVKS